MSSLIVFLVLIGALPGVLSELNPDVSTDDYVESALAIEDDDQHPSDLLHLDRKDEEVTNDRGPLDKVKNFAKNLVGKLPDLPDLSKLPKLPGLPGVPHCRQTSESCSGITGCCGKGHCFWETGYSLLKSGVCVPCVQLGQACQKDSQCCDPLVCQKSTRYQIDGQCDRKLPDGQECHDDDQCQSNHCQMSWLSAIRGAGGKCSSRN